MKRIYLGAAIFAVAICAGNSADADLAGWQSEVTSNGTTAAATHFTTVNGSAPTTINVGSLSNEMTFEFIVNSGGNGASQTLLGDRLGNDQGIKFEQWNDTGNYGITNFGVADFDSRIAHTTGTDIHLVFAFDGTDTFIWVNGVNVGTMTTDLGITGTTGLGNFLDSDGISFGGDDALDGDILGFASYDAELSGAEIGTHFAAFSAVPEPSSCGMLALASIGFFVRRRKS